MLLLLDLQKYSPKELIFYYNTQVEVFSYIPRYKNMRQRTQGVSIVTAFLLTDCKIKLAIQFSNM